MARIIQSNFPPKVLLLQIHKHHINQHTGLVITIFQFTAENEALLLSVCTFHMHVSPYMGM